MCGRKDVIFKENKKKREEMKKKKGLVVCVMFLKLEFVYFLSGDSDYEVDDLLNFYEYFC